MDKQPPKTITCSTCGKEATARTIRYMLKKTPGEPTVWVPVCKDCRHLKEK